MRQNPKIMVGAINNHIKKGAAPCSRLQGLHQVDAQFLPAAYAIYTTAYVGITLTFWR